MKCPECGSMESAILDTRDYATYRRRRRKCKVCASRYTTYEVDGTVFSSVQTVAVALSQLVSAASGPLVDLSDIIAARGEYDKK